LYGYFTAACQRTDWPSHKLQCKQLAIGAALSAAVKVQSSAEGRPAKNVKFVLDWFDKCEGPVPGVGRCKLNAVDT
jgi:hypothetical protein